MAVTKHLHGANQKRGNFMNEDTLLTIAAALDNSLNEMEKYDGEDKEEVILKLKFALEVVELQIEVMRGQKYKLKTA